MKDENIKTISRDFVKVDDENFRIVYTRTLNNPLNVKASAQGMWVWKSNLINAIKDINNKIKEIEGQIESYNEAVEDFDMAEAQLKMGIEVPNITSYADLAKEALESKQD
jgi:hypothetical protein